MTHYSTCIYPKCVPVAVDIARKGCESYGGCVDPAKCVAQGFCTRVEDARKAER